MLGLQIVVLVGWFLWYSILIDDGLDKVTLGHLLCLLFNDTLDLPRVVTLVDGTHYDIQRLLVPLLRAMLQQSNDNRGKHSDEVSQILYGHLVTPRILARTALALLMQTGQGR